MCYVRPLLLPEGPTHILGIFSSAHSVPIACALTCGSVPEATTGLALLPYRMCCTSPSSFFSSSSCGIGAVSELPNSAGSGYHRRHTRRQSTVDFCGGKPASRYFVSLYVYDEPLVRTPRVRDLRIERQALHRSCSWFRVSGRSSR
jgi:hypothetical protein